MAPNEIVADASKLTAPVVEQATLYDAQAARLRAQARAQRIAAYEAERARRRACIARYEAEQARRAARIADYEARRMVA